MQGSVRMQNSMQASHAELHAKAQSPCKPLHANRCMQTAACKPLHANRCMQTAACKPPHLISQASRCARQRARQ